MAGVDDSGMTPQREIYSVGLKRKVLADVQEIIATPSKGGGFRYQVVGIYLDEDGKEHKCQSMIGTLTPDQSLQYGNDPAQTTLR